MLSPIQTQTNTILLSYTGIVILLFMFNVAKAHARAIITIRIIDNERTAIECNNCIQTIAIKLCSLMFYSY